MSCEPDEPTRPMWLITADQLARGYWRRADDGSLTGPYAFVVITKLDDGVFQVEAPMGNVVEDETC